MGAVPSASSKNGGRAVAFDPANAAWWAFTADSMPPKSEAKLGIEFCRSEAASPREIKSKYRCPVAIKPVRVAASISFAVTQFSAELTPLHTSSSATILNRQTPLRTLPLFALIPISNLSQ
jgi:hypothetical protein